MYSQHTLACFARLCSVYLQERIRHARASFDCSMSFIHKKRFVVYFHVVLYFILYCKLSLCLFGSFCSQVLNVVYLCTGKSRSTCTLFICIIVWVLVQFSALTDWFSFGRGGGWGGAWGPIQQRSSPSISHHICVCVLFFFFFCCCYFCVW